jgi:nicotinate-nucleotide pyrophosphorylase (carboxylating)
MELSNTLQVKRLVRQAIAEDQIHQDVTTKILIPAAQNGKASVIAKGRGIIAGIEIARQVFLQVDSKLKMTAHIKDGARVKPGDTIAIIEGKTSSILKAERVALNFLQRLSGIASETNRYVQAVEGLPVYIMDTRKTTPGLRNLEKYAVRLGGGRNHRMHLADSILIKDNHISALRHEGLNIKEIIARAHQKYATEMKIEVEVKTPEEAIQAVEAGADIILLDNMNIEQTRQAVELVKGRALIEASGGITLENVHTVAETGVDRISIGALTHSAKALDISLELD